MKTFDKYETRGADYHYRQVSRSWKEYNAPVEARFMNLIEDVAQAAGRRPLKLLDVGSGDGVALWLLKKRLPNLHLSGIEPHREALAVARKKVLEADLREGSADAIPFGDASFDIVISSDVIEHVPDADAMLREMKRVAKEGATVIIGTPVRHSKFPLDHNHEQEWFPEDFTALVGNYFRDIRVRESHNLVPTLLYGAPPKSLFNFKSIVNLLSLAFRWNPFRAGRTNRMQMFAYMSLTCKK